MTPPPPAAIRAVNAALFEALEKVWAKEGEIAPVLFLVRLHGERIIGLTPLSAALFFQNAKTKGLIPEAVETFLGPEFLASLVVIVAEGWLRKATWTRGEPLPLDGPPPSEHPDRQEAVIANFYGPGGFFTAVYHPIDRHRNCLVKGEYDPKMQSFGRIVPTPGPAH